MAERELLKAMDGGIHDASRGVGADGDHDAARGVGADRTGRRDVWNSDTHRSFSRRQSNHCAFRLTESTLTEHLAGEDILMRSRKGFQRKEG